MPQWRETRKLKPRALMASQKILFPPFVIWFPEGKICSYCLVQIINSWDNETPPEFCFNYWEVVSWPNGVSTWAATEKGEIHLRTEPTQQKTKKNRTEKHPLVCWSEAQVNHDGKASLLNVSPKWTLLSVTYSGRVLISKSLICPCPFLNCESQVTLKKVNWLLFWTED